MKSILFCVIFGFGSIALIAVAWHLFLFVGERIRRSYVWLMETPNSFQIVLGLPLLALLTLLPLVGVWHWLFG